MSLKDAIVLWNEGVNKALDGKFEEAIAVWNSMQESGARISFNIASMHLLLGQPEKAEKNLDHAIKKDPHLALAYFQRGTIRLMKERYYEALSDLDNAIKNLRGNVLIDYKQLGLQYKLYSCEVMYNHAYGLYHTGRQPEAKEELERAKSLAASSSDSRHKIIVAALDNIRLGTRFKPYELPDKAMIFQPPRHKTEVLKPVNFLGKAKVLSSVVDQDSYVGFVGVQDEKQRQGRSPSPRPAQPSVPPPPKASTIPREAENHNRPPKPSFPPSARMPKPETPPPAPAIKIEPRRSSLNKEDTNIKRPTSSVSSIVAEFKKVNVQARPPKPNTTPPPLQSQNSETGMGGKSSTLPGKVPVRPTKSLEPGSQLQGRRSPQPQGQGKTSQKPGLITVKVHYSSTRALRVAATITYQQLQHLICKKFERPEDSLTLWCKKKSGELNEIESEQTLKEVSAFLDDGFRLTLWAYDKHESESEGEEPVLMEAEATHNYKGQYEDELTLKIGDRVEITTDINQDWYEGRCNGVAGIFPKSYVKVIST